MKPHSAGRTRSDRTTLRSSPSRCFSFGQASLLWLAATLVSVPALQTRADPEPPTPGSWTLTLDENFDGDSLDATIWRVGAHYGEPTPGTLGAIRPENISVANGKLKLVAEKRTASQNGVQKNYASGEITTWKKWRQKYGYFEARIKYDVQKGLWPAFWTMPDRGAPYGDEIERQVYIKFDLSGDSRTSVSSVELNLTTSYVGAAGHLHLYACKDNWSETGLTWNNQPELVGVWIGEKNNMSTTPGVISFSGDALKAYINEQLAGDKVISFCLVDGYQKERSVNFHSREATTASLRPKLVLSGSPGTVYATADSYVEAGTSVGANFGTETTLKTREPWDWQATSTDNAGMEIDILETLGVWGADEIQHAVHWDGYDSNHKTKHWELMKYAPTSDGFHTYGMYWEQGKLTFFIDGKKTMTWASAEVCDVSSFLLLSLQVGGWDGNTPPSTFPASEMLVDYVRAWSGTADATPSPDTTLTPIADGHVRGGSYATTNYGGSTALSTHVGSDVTNETYIWDTYLKFNVSGQSNIKKAVLSLTNSVNADEDTISMWETTDGWSESTLIWNNKPVLGDVISSGVAWADGGVTEIDVTDHIKTQAAGDGVASMGIQRIHAMDKTNFVSREGATPPVLKIWYDDAAGLAPTADSYVRDGTYANDNHGTESQLVVKQAGVNFLRWSLIKFSLAGQSTAQSAYLKLNVTSSTPSTIKIWTAAHNTWTETGVTWNNKPGKGNYVTSINVPSAGEYTINVKDFVNANLGGPISFLVEGTSEYVTMGSRESSSPPRLEIN